MSDTRFFVPRALADKLHEMPPRVSVLETTLKVGNIVVSGVYLKGRARAILPYLKRLGLGSVGEGVANDRVCLVYGTGGFVAVDSIDAATTTKHAAILQHMVTTLKRLSGLSGINIDLRLEREPFLPLCDSGVVRIVIGASPPGDVAVLERRSLCGVQLQENGEELREYGHAQGYGALVYDDESVVVAQIIDSTIYLFVPLDRELMLSPSGGNLFARAAVFAWNAYLEGATPVHVEPIDTVEEYINHAQKLQAKHVSAVDVIISDIDDRVRTAMRRIEELRREQLIFRAVKRGLESVASSETREDDLTAQFDALKANTLLARFGYLDAAFQVETVDLIAEHDGVHRLLGSYGIRIEYAGKVHVWALRSAHPYGIPHPHISKKGVVCFGNLTQAIVQSASEQDIPTAVGFVIRWLLEGYNPRSADTSIEEWPLVEGFDQ